MNGSHRLFFLAAVTLLVAGIASAGARFLQAASASSQRGQIWGNPHIGVLVDISSGMEEELDALGSVLGETDIVRIEDAVYEGFSFADTVSPGSLFFSENGHRLLQAWIQGLQTGYGGACPDAMLQALGAASFHGADSFTYKRLLLASDSAPIGGRAAFARTTNNLAAQGVQVYPLQSGWCQHSPFPTRVMKQLSLLTGGTAFLVTPGHEMMLTHMALNLMAAGDDLLLANGVVVPGAPDTYKFEVDGSVASMTLQLNNGDDWPCPGCLPNLQLTSQLPLTFTVRLPGGGIVNPGDPGVTVLESDYGTQLQIKGINGGLPAGEWQVRVGSAAQAPYELRVAAETGYQLRYLGPTTVPSGVTFKLSVALDGDVRTAYTARIFDVSTGEVVWADEIYDDGQHGDSAAGDGIFAGPVSLPPGAHRLMVTGELANGTTLQRMAAVPIRARRFGLQAPPDRQVQAGAHLQYSFVLTNDGNSSQSYDLLALSEEGWADTSTLPVSVTLDAGQAFTVAIPFHVPDGAEAGAIEETSLTVLGEDLVESETVVVRTTIVGSERIYVPLVRQP